MSITRRGFEIAVCVLWEYRGTADAWERTATAIHGIRLVAQGKIKEDADLLYEIAWARADMARAEAHEHRLALAKAA